MSTVIASPDRRSVRQLRHPAELRPFLVIWEVTRACDLACLHCRAEAIPRRHPDELTTDEGRRLLRQIASFGRPAPLVVLTGGDPFVRPDLVDLVAEGRELGLHVALSPSVTPRFTRDVLVELRDAGAGAISLSLDGATAGEHDAFRGVDGVFAATLEAAGWIRELGMRLQVNSTVTAGNADALPALLRLVDELGAGLWSVFFLVGTGRGAHLQALDAPDTEDVLHFLVDASAHVAIKTTEAPHYRRVLLQRHGGLPAPASPRYRRLRAGLDEVRPLLRAGRRPTRPPLDVNAGRGFVFVSHVGEVQPSGFLPLSAGSVRERTLPELYQASPLFRSLRDPDVLAGRCGRCEFRSICGGSRSRAYATAGDALGEDPTCAYEPAAAPRPAS